MVFRGEEWEKNGVGGGEEVYEEEVVAVAVEGGVGRDEEERGEVLRFGEGCSWISDGEGVEVRQDCVEMFWAGEEAGEVVAARVWKGGKG